MPVDPETLPADPLRRLEAIMAVLLGPDGCPWDKEQDHRTLRTNLLEEAYEVLQVLDAPGRIQDRKLAEELGDLLLQIVFHAALAHRRDSFSLDDVASLITEKLIRRHPHVFSDVEVRDADDVRANWEQIKQEEGRTSSLEGVPPALPALLRAATVLSRAEQAGFRWPDITGARAKVDEEMAEFTHALEAGEREAVDHEFGDLLLSLITLARMHGTEPESALREAVARFENRFRRMEAGLARRGIDLSSLAEAELLQLWDQSRRDDDPQSPSGSPAPAS